MQKIKEAEDQQKSNLVSGFLHFPVEKSVEARRIVEDVSLFKSEFVINQKVKELLSDGNRQQSAEELE